MAALFAALVMAALTAGFDHDARIEALLDGLHRGQERYIFARDPHNPDRLSRQTCLLSPTRWGKTDGVLRYFAYRAQTKPNYSALALGITRSSAKAIMWPKLKELAQQYGWEMRWFNELELALTFPGTRGTIRLSGADRPEHARLIRGQEHDDILIDEAQDFRYVDLQYLCESICMPRLSDRRGRLWLQGTPGPVEGGYFYEAVWKRTNPLWVAIQGEQYENHYNESEQRELDDIYRRANPNVEQEPWYQRERLGLWVVDTRALLVRLTAKQNYLYRGQWKPHADDRYLLGVRWGFARPSGYVLAVWNTTAYPHLVYLEGWRRQMSLRDHVTTLQGYRDKYEGLKIVIEATGPTRSVVEDLRREHRISVVEAGKLNADFHDDKMQSDASLGLIKVYNPSDPDHPEKNGLAQSWSKLAWQVNPETGQRTAPDQRQVHDAALCIRRAVNLSLFSPAEQPPSTEDLGRMTPAERKRAMRQMGVA